MLISIQYTQIQKQIISKNNDRNKYFRSNTSGLALLHIRFSNWNYNQKEIIKTIYYEKESLELLGIMPV